MSKLVCLSVGLSVGLSVCRTFCCLPVCGWDIVSVCLSVFLCASVAVASVHLYALSRDLGKIRKNLLGFYSYIRVLAFSLWMGYCECVSITVQLVN